MRRHPRASGRASGGLVVGAIERMPCCGVVKAFHAWNETTVATIETKDCSGRDRAGVVIGFSRDDRSDGVATYSTIEEAEAFLQLVRNAIDDAKRIEAGQAPLAQEGRTPPTAQ